MLKRALSSLMAISLFSLSVNLQALDPAKDCTKEILYSFFPEVFVNEALEKNNIPKEKWAKINSDLKEKDKGMIKSFEVKLSQMPESTRTNKSEKIQAFRDTLQDTFISVFNDNGIDDEELILTILDDIQEPRAKRFQECMQYHEQQMPEDQKQYSEQ
jgi:hypothetical protein